MFLVMSRSDVHFGFEFHQNVRCLERNLSTPASYLTYWKVRIEMAEAATGGVPEKDVL